MARECPWAKGKGKGKSAKGMNKGKGKGEASGGKGKGKKGWGKAVGKAGGWSTDGFGGKGGKGYKGTCWNCGKVGHNANECPSAWGVQWIEDEIDEGDEEQIEDVGGVFDVEERSVQGPWTIAEVELVARGEGGWQDQGNKRMVEDRAVKNGTETTVDLMTLAEIGEKKKASAKEAKDRRKAKARERCMKTYNEQGVDGLMVRGGRGCGVKGDAWEDAWGSARAAW